MRCSRRAAREALEHANVLLWCDPLGKFVVGDLAFPAGRPSTSCRTFGDRPAGADRSDPARIVVYTLWTDGVWTCFIARSPILHPKVALIRSWHYCPAIAGRWLLARDSLMSASASIDRGEHALAAPRTRGDPSSVGTQRPGRAHKGRSRRTMSSDGFLVVLCWKVGRARRHARHITARRNASRYLNAAIAQQVCSAFHTPDRHDGRLKSWARLARSASLRPRTNWEVATPRTP